jgi:peptidoglycan/LPS O-acetylase OafA/YrhL
MRKLLPLTGLRALAALWVVLFHFRYLFSFGVLNPLIDKGYLGVDLFFVLSGFIIAYVHRKDFENWPLKSQDCKRGLRFLALRCARMLPVHYVTLGLLILMDAGRALLAHQSLWQAHAVKGAQGDLLLNLVNLQGWGLSDHNSWNIPAWSISSEWFAYLLFPAIALFVLPRLKSITGPLLLMTLCFWGLSSFMACLHLPGIDWTVHYSLIRVTAEFVIGCALCALFSHTQENSRWAGLLAVASIVLLFGNIALHGSDMLSLFSLTGLLLSLAIGGHSFAKLLSVPPMLYLGEISFSTYMMYSPVVLTFNSIDFHSHWMARFPHWILFTGLLLTQLIAASLLYALVEKPARNFLRRHIIDRFLAETTSKAVKQSIQLPPSPTVLPPQGMATRVLPSAVSNSPPSKTVKRPSTESSVVPFPQPLPGFTSWKPFSEQALSYKPIRRPLPVRHALPVQASDPVQNHQLAESQSVQQVKSSSLLPQKPIDPDLQIVRQQGDRSRPLKLVYRTPIPVGSGML